MNPKDAQDLAKVLAKQPGIRSVDQKDVRKLAELLREFPEIGSIEVKGWFDTGVIITRTGNSVPHAAPLPVAVHHPVAGHHPAPAGPVAASPAAAAPGSASASGTALKDIKSPMVGTFYKSPEPGAEAYVKVGTRVTQGQTVCIIEAMKIMNEIEAEVTGVVREVLVEDSQPVEFGTVLFRVDPNG
jgi:acetyl-CoA carboxylase biotin carboxyl carrier protein